MAIKSAPPRRIGRRVPLSRSGGKNGPVRNKKREEKQKCEWHIPWHSFGKTCLAGGILLFFLVFLAVLGTGLLYGYRYMTTTQYFSLKNIEIQGISRLDSREILEITKLQEGINILSFSIDEVEAALLNNPWVKNVSVKRILPDTLVVGVSEKIPAFWVLHNGVLYYADAHGGRIAPVGAGALSPLPVLEVEPGAEDATAALPDLVRSLEEAHLPLKVSAVSWVRLSPSRGVEVFVENSQLKISIGLEDWLTNLQRLDRVLVDLQRRGELPNIQEIRAQGSNVWVEKKPEAGANG